MKALRTPNLLRSRKFTIACSAGFALLGLLLLLPFWRSPATQTVRMSAGPVTTRLHKIAAWMCEKGAQNELDVRLVPTAGAQRSLELLQANELDAAIVSNGVVVPHDDDIVVLAAAQLETVHVLVRRDIAASGPLLQTIRGKKVNLGERGSTEWLLSQDLLTFSRIALPTDSQPGDFIPVEFSKAELLARSQVIQRASGSEKAELLSELPDCLIVLAPLPSPLVQSLIEAADYQLLPLRETRAFLLDHMQDGRDQKTVLQREFLEPTVIPTSSYFAQQGYPESDCETIGVRSLLVARKDLSATIVQRLMKTILASEVAHRFATKSPREVATPYEIHSAAAAYLDRDKPLIVNSVLDGLNNFLSVVGALFACGLSLLSLMWQVKQRKPADYYAEIRKIEDLSRTADLQETGLLNEQDLLKHLDERLVRLRHDLIEDICEGRIKGDQAIANIMILLREARRNVTINSSAQSADQPQELKIWRKAA